MDKTRNIVENTILEQERKYGGNYRKFIKVKCVAKLRYKLKNKTENINIERYNVIGDLNKIMQSSKGMIEFIGVFELKIRVKGRIYKDVLYLYLECENIPILWKKIYENCKRWTKMLHSQLSC